MRSLALMLGILGVFGAVLWQARQTQDGGALQSAVRARVHTVDLADAPAFQALEPVVPPPAEPPEPESGAPLEAPDLQDPSAKKVPQAEPGPAAPASGDEPFDLVAVFDPDRSARLVRRLLTVYARLGGADAEAPAP